jgi:2-dehydro-3-deoxyglucarate aldolase/4-hydroxy-2-oxoheptanedioate aldolase
MHSVIKQRLDAGQIVRVMVIGALANPKLVEAAALHGNFHGIWFDQEHSGLTHPQLEMLTMAARAAGTDAFSRVAPTDYATLMRPYEAGCSGVMAAQVTSLEQVRQIVSWTQFAPAGTRGTFTSNYECGYGARSLAEYVETANRERWLAIQIETAQALDAVEQIAAVDGVDLLFVGPADLSVSLEVPGEMLHPKCVDALKRVAAACAKVGKPWGVLCPTVEHARTCRELGARLLSLHSDTGIFRRGIASLEESFAEFMD